MSLSLIAVFIPIFLMAGVVGRLFRQFAVTLSIAVCVSMVISLTITPMMCATILKPHTDNHNWIYRLNEWIFNLFRSFYRWSLGLALRFSPITFMATLGAVALATYLFINIPKGFFPQQDIGQISGSITADQSTSSQVMRKVVEDAAKVVAEDPAVENFVAFAGGGRGGGSNTGNMNIALKPVGQRKDNADQVRMRLTRSLSRYPGVQFNFQAQQDVRVGGRMSRSLVTNTPSPATTCRNSASGPRNYSLKCGPSPALSTPTPICKTAAWKPDSPMTATPPHAWVSRPPTSTTALYDAFGQRQVSTLYASINQYRVVMEVQPRFAQDPSALNFIRVRNNAGKLIPLSAFTHYESANHASFHRPPGPLPLHHTLIQPPARVFPRLRCRRHQPGTE